ncbi:L,D-transpeptidase [Corynebacterium pygosceleis]|uniref:L,D-transpeptidase n=1 Tax=Corynebacterium pygosceleis TaxID=2800406 RepID=A0ABT3WVV2_9CORY|nr:L,D-transpeptidase [Corynebacterium pygosceleis]MCK7674736.1 L,D-transpeptidase [Corynebacterium pygosceleis]MCL0119675.1 L,D-transpeptidase [Corynebacterium pygosceleis]MCX7444922.1 L,D-transpeptidase [Corynebacterium pygosceleis]
MYQVRTISSATTSALRRFLIVASVALTFVFVLSPVGANAAPAVGSSVGSSGSSDLNDDAWNLRNDIHQRSNGLPPVIGDGVKAATDGAVDLFFPGLIAQRSAEEAARMAPPPAPEPAPAPEFDRGSCPAAARACIDLTNQRTWLQDNGRVTYGAVPMSSGAVGWETPKGVHYVNRKVKDEISREFNNAPMPYSVYFTHTGIAFHQGDVNLWSHGCIHLNHADAVTFFDSLRVGDMVYVY